METNANETGGGEIMYDLTSREERSRISAELTLALLDVGFRDKDHVAEMVLIAMISMASKPYCPLCYSDDEDIAGHIRKTHVI
jgi:hypothetical protein